ncbi:MAG: hypothetical protein KF686_03340 [Ramlibacter sp.]|nr:hypothetical protein [Ramlibacter sp.]
MILETYNKQPNDAKDYDINYSEWLASGDTLSDATARVDLLSGTDVSPLVVDSIVISDQAVKLWISGGTDGCKYKVTVLATTNNSPPRIDESELIFKLKDF